MGQTWERLAFLHWPVDLISSFPEINVRTYVTRDAKPGIWFLSLDTSNPLAVHAARKAYRLRYQHASQAVRRRGVATQFASRRRDDAARFAARYAPTGPVREARRGSFEEFVAERYCLYTMDERGELLRADIRHRPWPLQTANVEIGGNSMARPYGIDLTGRPRAHYAEHLDVVLWRLTR
jgi:uncharacterized protein YqjF (DUF2071 family)